MTMLPRWEMPHATAKEAMLAAQESCIRERGNRCIAYDGINCSSCPKYQEGLKRREEKIEREKKAIVAQIILTTSMSSSSRKIMRLRKEGSCYNLEIGYVYDDYPGLFRREEFLILTKEEKEIAARLLQMD